MSFFDPKENPEKISPSSDSLDRDFNNLQELIDLSPDIFFRINLQGFLDYLSPSADVLLVGAKEKWNLDRKSILPKTPDNKNALKKIKSLAKKENAVPACRLVVHGQNEAEITLEIQGRPACENGKVIGYIGTARDISSLLKIEASDKKQKEQAKRELDLAAQVHLTLIPENIDNARVSIAINYLPFSGVGGDYANYKLLNDGNIIFTICDVTGHGIAAALLVNRLDSEFERLARVNAQPGHLLNRFNNFIKENFEGTRMFLSAFCGLLNFSTMKLIYSNYGHPPQFLYQAKDSSVTRLSAQTHFMGILRQKLNMKYEDVIDIEPGDRLICFTDGLIEADRADNEMFGYERLKEFISKNTSLTNEEFNENLIEEVESFSVDGFDDDLCVLSIDIK